MASEATLERLRAEFDSPPEAIAAAVALLEQQCTPAYLARYRRWAIGNLGEERLIALSERLHTLLDIEQRKQAIVQQARERGRDPAEVEREIADIVDQDYLDDLYQSLRPRRRGIAMQMEEKGLLPLAMAIQHRQVGEQPLLDTAAQYLRPEAGLSMPEQALEGALLILADRVAHDPATRAAVRAELKHGVLRAKPTAPDHGQAKQFADLFDFAEPIGRIPPNRMLALRRAEREGILALELTLPEGRPRLLLRELHAADLPDGSPLQMFYDLVFDQAWPQLQEYCGKDVRRRLKEKADREAVRAYARNLRSQLMAPPLGAKKVLALRTSGKNAWAVLVGEDGHAAQHKTLPLDSAEQQQGALAWLVELVRTEQPAAIAVPHGRRQAGSEKLVAELRTALGETPLPMVVPVDEAAATIHASSQAGKKAMPGVDVGVRTALSLGRRLQDPLLELARMDARTLGIGQTLDDVHQGMLQRELAAVTGSCLAAVGLDLNTASLDLLEQLPGLDGERARALVDQRKRIGGFPARQALAEVPGFDAAAVRNVAGFLRIQGGSEPLDQTPLHPEDYDLARAAAQVRGAQPLDLIGQNLRDTPLESLITEAQPRARVIAVLQQLMRAGEDCRGILVPIRNEGVHSLTDLHVDRELQGRVAGLTEFGAFIDLGIGHDGLCHLSQIPPHRVRDPQQMLCVGEVVTVWVLHVDQQQEKIALSMYQPRHLQEGRLATLGERMAQQGRGQGRRERPAEPQTEPRSPGRPARSAEGRRGERRGPPGPGESSGRPPRRGEGGRDSGGGRDFGGRDFGGGDFGGRDAGGRGRSGRGQRVYTAEPEKTVAEQRTHKGEVTSLASLRALFGGGSKPTPPATDSPE